MANRYGSEVAGDDVSAADASAGVAEMWTFDLWNQSADLVTGLVAWIDPATTRIAISTDGLAWSSPFDQANAVALGSLAANAKKSLYVRRAVPPGASADPEAMAVVRLAWFIPLN